jgi:hypothetical protein
MTGLWPQILPDVRVVHSRPAVKPSQLRLGPFQFAPARSREIPAGATDVEIQIDIADW